MRKRISTLTCVLLAAIAACGANNSDYRAQTSASCDPPAEKVGTETTVATSGFVREVAVVGDAPWVALRGGMLEKLDPACHTSLATVDLGTAVPPGPPGTTLDFVAIDSADGATIWTIVEWLNQAGSPEAYYVLRVDTRAMKVTATQRLADLDYSRTSHGLAVNGDNVWVADAAAGGTAARLDPKTAAVADTVQTPAGAQSVSQDIAADDEGRVWVADGQHSIVVLDASGAQQGRIELGPADSSNPNIAAHGHTAWLAGEQLQLVDTDSDTIVGVSPTKVGEMSPAEDGLWAVSYTPQQAVVHITAGQPRTTATYPVNNETVSMDSHGSDIWRVDFEGVLHHIAG